MDVSRRNLLAAAGGAAMFASPLVTAIAQTPPAQRLKVRLLLNSGIAGPHAFFCLAFKGAISPMRASTSNSRAATAPLPLSR